MFAEVQENCSGFPNDKIIALMIYKSRNTSVRIDFGIFFALVIRGGG